MRIPPLLYGFLVVGVLMGVIVAFQSAGVWSVSGKIDGAGKAVQPAAADVTTIKGWMTLEQITTAYQVPLADLLTQFGLPIDTPANTAIKDLEGETFTTTALRDWLTTRQAVPSAAPERPSGATAVPTITEPQPDLQPSVSAGELLPEPDATATRHPVPAMTITGKTTVQDLVDWGMPIANIQTVLGVDLPPSATSIKDYVSGQGLEFAAVKAALQAEIDRSQ